MTSRGPVYVEIVENHVAVVRFNRPEARNAVNGALARELANLVMAVEASPELRVAILASSTPGMFCAGADLKEVAAGKVDGLRIGSAGFGGFVDAPRAKPWIAAVDGPALGGGFELCLACDIIVASASARFGLPEVQLGMLAGAGGVHRIARVLPRNLALELVATGGRLEASVAERFGMVNRLVEPGRDVVDAALAIAATIAGNAPISVVEGLALARIAGEREDSELRLLSRRAIERVMASEDAKEGPRAFTEKRSPRWLGR